MAKDEQKHIYHSAKLFYYILKFLGLAPYRFDDQLMSFKMGFLEYFWFFASTTFYMILNINHVTHFSSFAYDTGVQSSLLDILWQYQFVLQHIFATAIVIFQFVQRKRVENFLKLIYKFDRAVENMNWRFKVVHRSNILLICNIISAVLVIGFQFMGVVKGVYKDHSYAEVINLIAFAVITDFHFVVLMQFIFSVYCIYARFRALMRNVR